MQYLQLRPVTYSSKYAATSLRMALMTCRLVYVPLCWHYHWPIVSCSSTCYPNAVAIPVNCNPAQFLPPVPERLQGAPEVPYQTESYLLLMYLNLKALAACATKLTNLQV